MAKYFRHYTQQRVGGGGGNYFKCQEGENRIRIFPFLHEVQEGDFKLGRYLPGEVEVGTKVEELFCQSRKHFKPTVHTCGLLRTADGRYIGNCETCDNVRIMLNSNAEEDKVSARFLKARHSYALWVVDMANISAGPQLYEAPQTILDQVQTYATSPRNANKTLFGEEGRNFCVIYQKKNHDGSRVAPGQMYSVMMEDKEDSEVLPDQPIEDLYLRPQFVPEEFQVYLNVDLGTPAVQEDEEEAPAPEKKTTRKKRVTKKKTPVVTEKEVGPPAPEPEEDEAPVQIKIGSQVQFDLDGSPVVGLVTGGFDKEEGGWLVMIESGEGFRVTDDEITVVQ